MRLVVFAYALPVLTKLSYKPVGIACGVVGGRIAAKTFMRVWEAIADERHSPEAMDRHRGWGEVVAAAAVKGAVFGSVKALADRAGATAFERATGTWPGMRGPDS